MIVMTRNRLKLCILLIAVLFFAVFPADVSADSGRKSILLYGEPGALDGGSGGDHLYFGSYMQTTKNSAGEFNMDPIDWRLLEADTGNNRLFLFSEKNLNGDVWHKFADTQIDQTLWKDSFLRNWLNGESDAPNNFVDDAFDTRELPAIANTVLEDSTDKVFLLSKEEAENTTYFLDNWDRAGHNTPYLVSLNPSPPEKTAYGNSGCPIGSFWPASEERTNAYWLRSRASTFADTVEGGKIDHGVIKTRRKNNEGTAIRPAMKLDLDQVLFLSSADDGKSAAGMNSALTEIPTYTGNEWKVTVKDTVRSGFTASRADAEPVTAGESINMTYSGAMVGPNEYVSAMLLDNSGTLMYYGRLKNIAAEADASGELAVQIPAGVANGTYTLSLFNEQFNGAKRTDYASPFVSIENLTIFAAHSHDGSSWQSDDTDHWKACATCSKKISKSAHVPSSDWKTDNSEHWKECACGDRTEVGPHSYGDWYITTAPTEFNPGVRTHACSSCNHTETESIAALGHSYSSDWTYNTTSHWNECACGDKTNVALHDYDDWVEITPATETSEGEKQHTCRTCNYVESASIPMLPHSHLPGTDWVYNETSHWHECSCGDKSDIAYHSYGDWTETVSPSEYTPGEKQHTCGDCGYTEYALIPALGHSHAAGSQWLYNGTNHWNECSCGGKMNISQHSYYGWVEVTAPTETTRGKKQRSCSICGYVQEGSIPALPRRQITQITTGTGNRTASTSRPGTGTTTRPGTGTGAAVRPGSRPGSSSVSNRNATYSGKDKDSSILSSWEQGQITLGRRMGGLFDDMAESDRYYKDVEFVYLNRLMSGTSTSSFSPDATITRTMIANLLWRMEGSPKLPGSVDYEDVKNDNRDSAAIRWASQNEIMTAYYGNFFGPGFYVKREELADFFYRYALLKGYDVTITGSIKDYKDGDKVSDWAADAMDWAIGFGLIESREDGTLEPQGHVSRAELAAMLHRFIKKENLIEGITETGQEGWVSSTLPGIAAANGGFGQRLGFTPFIFLILTSFILILCLLKQRIKRSYC